MIFYDNLNHNYTVEEISTQQAKNLLAQQLLVKSDEYESIDLVLDRKYSYRTVMNLKKRGF